MVDHAAALKGWIAIALIATCVVGAQAGKVLIATSPVGKSHLMNLKVIAKEIEQRGHSVMWVAMSADVSFLRPTNSTIISYAMQGKHHDTAVPEFRVTADTTWSKLWQGLNLLMADSCVGLMSNQTALDQMQAFQADIMIAEVFTPCSALLAHTLDLPWINFWPGSPAEPFGNAPWAGSNRRMVQPNPLSYYPQFRTKGTGPTTQHLSLWQRVENYAMYWFWLWDDWRIHSAVVRKLYKRYDFDPDAPEERRRMALTIVPVDWAAEWLRPVTPNYKLVGPILSGPGKALPAHLEAFMNEAGEQGVLLVSLGTIAELDQKQLKGMAAAFAALPSKVLWRLTAKEVPDEAAMAALELGNNTQVLTWVPQNDILAHPNLKAFLSHVGINSMYEAIYHGKPLVCMPFFADQPTNADRVVAKGFGVRLDPSQAGMPGFREAIMEVLSNPQYTEAAQAMSVKIRARKNTPVQEAADWVEHVIATKGEPYLKTPEDELSFIVRNSLDIYAILAACCCIFAFAAKATVQLLLSSCRSRSPPSMSVVTKAKVN